MRQREATMHMQTTRKARHMRAIAFSLVAVLLFVLILSCGMFLRSYFNLQEAILQERMSYVEEISEQVITSQRFMEKEYSDTVMNYAHILNSGVAGNLEDVRDLLRSESASDILLLSASGELKNLNGQGIFLASNELLLSLSGSSEVVQIFTSLNSEEDYWIFAQPIDHILLGDTVYDAILLAISAEDFRDSLAISLFKSRGATYIIKNDGSIEIKPEGAHLAFRGYNLFTSMLQAGASEEDVALLEADMWDSSYGSFQFTIGSEDWLISHDSIDSASSIVVAVPLAVTAAQTYAGLSSTIIFASTAVVSLAGIAILLILFFSYRDKQRSRKAMAVAAKSDFFSKMSHDIRTPLNAVMGLEALAKDSSDNPQLVREYLSQSSAAASYLMNIINDVLDMNRIESGKLTIASLPFDMNSLVMEIKGIASAMTAEKGLDFEVEVDSPFETAYIGDQVRVKQILINLLSNASKFTKAGGSVKLTVAHTTGGDGYDSVTLVVSDTGIGMSREFLSRIFLPFEQEHSSYTQQYTGSGLGLSIVHSLVSMMKGGISVESTEGVGSSFIVTLPFERTAAPISTGEEETAPAVVTFPGRRALLVEDSPVNQRVAVALLQKKFYLEVDVASDGRQAVDLFAASPEGFYDLIFMDIKMPNMDGLEATRRIRELPRPDAKSLPIIALSANAFAEDVALSLEAGMNDHLSKPIDIAALGDALRKMIRNEGL